MFDQKKGKETFHEENLRREPRENGSKPTDGLSKLI